MNTIERKRTMTASSNNEEEEGTKGLNNKERARLHRQRKKRYYENIEKEVEELRDKLRVLAEENQKLKEEVGRKDV